MGAGTEARTAPGGLCSPRISTSLLLECTQWGQKVGRTLQVGKRPGRKAKLAATGTGQGQGLEDMYLQGTGWAHEKQQPQTITLGGKTGCREGQSSTSKPEGTYSALSHTCTPMWAHTHSHSCTHRRAHTYTHMQSRTQRTHIHPTGAPTHAHIHAGSNLETLALVLEVPAATAVSLEGAFLQTPHNLPEPRLCPRANTWLPTESGELDASWQGQDGLRLWGEDREPQV